MPRTKAIFDWIFALDTVNGPGLTYDITYATASDDGLPADLIKARIQREQNSLKSVCVLDKASLLTLSKL